MIEMMETDAAYLAGLLDGEGCISMFLAKQYHGNGKVGERVGISLSLYMTHKETMEHVKKITRSNANILFVPGRGNRQDQYLWKPNLSEAYDIIVKCLPFMVTKRRNAELFTEIIDLRKKSSRANRNWDEQLRIMEENKALNKRGRDLIAYIYL